VLPKLFKRMKWKLGALFFPKTSFLLSILDMNFKMGQINLTTYDALNHRRLRVLSPIVDWLRYDYSPVKSNELLVEKTLLVKRFKKSLVRIILIADEVRLDVRDMLLALYTEKAYGLGFAMLSLNMPLDSFQGKNTGVVGLERDGRDAEALKVRDGMLMFGSLHTNDLTTAPKFVELVLGQWGPVSQQLPHVEALHSVHPDAIKYYEAVMLYGHALDSLLKTCGATCVRSELSAQVRKEDFMSLSGQIAFAPGTVFRSEAWLLLNIWGIEAVPVYKVDIKTGALTMFDNSSRIRLLLLLSRTHASLLPPLCPQTLLARYRSVVTPGPVVCSSAASQLWW
jgi:hypothetical protein